MSVGNSPMYVLGQLDGLADAERISQCPAQPALGPTPPIPKYPVMYERGYHDAFDGTVPHLCTDKCKK